jgi:predicted nucleotidyltransferase
MVEISDIVKSKIRKFISILEADNIHIQKAILFGSYAAGRNDEWSDIDLAIISEDFVGNRFHDKLELNKYIFSSSLDISPLPFRPEDFENSMFARDEIIKKGIVVHS